MRFPFRRPTHSAMLVAALAMSAAALASGCATSDDAESQSAAPSGDTAPTATGSPSSLSASSPASPSPTIDEGGPDAAETDATTPILGDAWTTQAQTKEPELEADDQGLVFHDLRVGEHDGFYRVVLEFVGAGDPGWFLSWSDKPVEQGRGLPLDVQGSAFLDIAVTGTTMPAGDEQAEQYYSGPQSVAVGPLDVVEDGTFEDQTHVVIGMDDVREFQIGTLTDPVRVVIDVRQ